MPYLVTNKQRMVPAGPSGAWRDTTRAYVSLDDAIRAAWKLTPDYVPDYVKAKINGLPEKGGWIDLPDRNAIQVEHVGWLYIEGALGYHSGVSEFTDAEKVDAYNREMLRQGC